MGDSIKNIVISGESIWIYALFDICGYKFLNLEIEKYWFFNIRDSILKNKIMHIRETVMSSQWAITTLGRHICLPKR